MQIKQIRRNASFIHSFKFIHSKNVSDTFISRVNSLCDEQAAGLRLRDVRVSQGELVGREAKGVVAHLPALRPVGADPTEHGLLLGAVDRRRGWRGGQSVTLHISFKF